MGLIKLGIIGYVAWLIVGSFLSFHWKMEYHRNGCGYEQCRQVGMRLEPVSAAANRKESQRRTAPTLCKAYFEGSTWDRWVRMRERGWCEEYPQYDPNR
ncbi:hypothetical protein [Ensifer aridi]|uniref:hypothetical protein n=1 Tax=Ensifer aridi TaxID=1708715 RepID=UPI000A0FF338|nr:hypothetical protein [Ensifer aridi]